MVVKFNFRFLILTTAIITVSTAPVWAAYYHKEFIAEAEAGLDIDPIGLPIDGGAYIETRGGDRIIHPWVQFKNQAGEGYDCAVTLHKSDVMNGGMPIFPAGKPTPTPNGGISQVPADAGVKTGWMPPMKIVGDAPAHTIPNYADVIIAVSPYQAGKKDVMIRDPFGGTTTYPLYGTVTVDLIGHAYAGRPTKEDGEQYHSAASFAAVDFLHNKVFRFDDPDKGKLGGVTVRSIFAGGTGEYNPQQEQQGSYQDPMYIDVWDISDELNPQLVATEWAAIYDAQWCNAAIEVSDSQIQLTAFLGAENSQASIVFDTNPGWVENPYSYSVMLTPDGLTGTGVFSPEFWTVETAEDRITATMDMPETGLPFDLVSMQVPVDILIPDHTYAVTYGGGDGAYEIATPEPTTILLLGLGGLVLLRRRRG